MLDIRKSIRTFREPAASDGVASRSIHCRCDQSLTPCIVACRGTPILYSLDLLGFYSVEAAQNPWMGVSVLPPSANELLFLGIIVIPPKLKTHEHCSEFSSVFSSLLHRSSIHNVWCPGCFTRHPARGIFKDKNRQFPSEFLRCTFNAIQHVRIASRSPGNISHGNSSQEPI